MESVESKKLISRCKYYFKVFERACKEFEIGMPEEYRQMSANGFKGVTSLDIGSYFSNIEDTIRNIIRTEYKVKWLLLVDQNYTDEHEAVVFKMIDDMFEHDPVCLFDFFPQTVEMIEKLQKNQQAAVKELKQYGREHTIEDIINNYGIVSYSVHEKVFTDAIKQGLFENPKVKSECVAAFFGDSPAAVGSQPGEDK